MPLTLAHPAAVLPLKRWGLPLSALVIGSISPDFEYLFHLAPVSTVSHTIHGLFIFCLPTGLIVLLLLSRIWEPAVISLFNENQLAREAQTEAFSFRTIGRYAIICLAVLMGAISHVLWDSFTHQYGWMVRHVAVLTTPILTTRWGTVPLFKFLQHGSTGLGLAILMVIAVHHRARFKTIPRAAWRMSIIVLVSGGALAVVCSLMRFGLPADFRTLARFAGVTIVEFFFVVIAEVTVLSLVWHGRQRRGWRR